MSGGRSFVPERGDVVKMSFDPQSGHEQSGWRPALVVSPGAYNRASSLALPCPITSRVSKGISFRGCPPHRFRDQRSDSRGPDSLPRLARAEGEFGRSCPRCRRARRSRAPGAARHLTSDALRFQSTGGLPQDPECNDTRTAPDGGIANACLESAVTSCNSSDPHMGACNSPYEWDRSPRVPHDGRGA